MHFAKQLQERKRHLAVLGLGYVGLPLAVRFSEHFSVLGLDQNEEKIASYRDGHDVTEEVGDEALGRASIRYTSDMSQLVQASFIIVAVPTPVHPRTGVWTRLRARLQDWLLAGAHQSGRPQAWSRAGDEDCLRL